MKIFSLLLGLLALSGFARADVIFYVHGDCQGDSLYCAWNEKTKSWSPPCENGEHANLKKAKQTVIKYESVPEDGTNGEAPSIEVGTRTVKFNDRLSSVKITNDEEVGVYVDTNFEGTVRYLEMPQGCDGREGCCVNLEDYAMNDVVSSFEINLYYHR